MHLQTNGTLESSHPVARICLKTNCKDILLHGTPQSSLSVTVELFRSLSIEECYVASNDAVFWDVLTVASIIDVLGNLNHVALVRIDVSEEHRIHLQTNEALKSSHLLEWICGDESLLQCTP
jgi:hypothetical protein